MEVLGPYPAYRDTGVEWLGQLPDGWAACRQRDVASLRVSNVDKHTIEGEEAIRLCNYVDVYKNDRITNVLSFSKGSATENEREQFRVRRGDVLITKDSEAWDDIAVPALVEHEAPDLVCGYHLAILRPRGEVIDGAFLFRVTQSACVAAQYHVASKGVTRFGLSHGAIKGVFLPLPPKTDQTAIVRFLDHADRGIQRYIRAKESLIELLEEEKQAIIDRAVTRGLDPHVKLKPSRVEWLGDVPEHWQSTTLHRITDPGRPIMYGIVLPGPSVDDGVFIVKGGNCEPGRLRPELLSRTSYEIEEKHVRSRLRKDDIVYAIRGSIGSAELVPAELEGANLTQDAARIAPGRGVEPRWLLHMVRSSMFFRKLDASAVGAAVRGINIRDLKRADLAIPPIAEQQAIAEHLDLSLNKLSTASDRAAAEIRLLGEYRTRLISDVVTGKLDVREAATKLPHDSAADAPEVDDVLEEAMA